MRTLFLLCLSLLFAGTRPLSAQQPVSFAAEMAAPVYSTLAQSGGVKWVAYGYLYPPGTFAERQPCAPVEDAAPIGSYLIRGEWGNAAEHAATYVLRFGRPNEGKQFVFSGIVGFVVGESGLPDAYIFDGRRLVGGAFIEEWQIEIAPRSPDCFGGAVRVGLPAGLREKPVR